MEELFIGKITDDFKPLINSWWNDLGHPGLPSDAYPDISLIVFHGSEPICAGCAYKTDSPLVYLDNLIANPNANKDIRDKAIDKLVRNIMDEAKWHGFKYWSATSKLKSVFERSKKFNMTQSSEGHYWFTGEL